MQPTIPELGDRAREIFRHIVEGYLASGTPVGSRTLSKLTVLGLSPASIRNVMQDLEELGLLAAPHPSAGRVPTDIGLRLFVDGMMQAHELTAAEQAALEDGARPRSDAMEDVLARTTAALAAMAQCAGVVFAPKAEAAIRQINFVALSPGRALAVLVGEGGSVENRIIELPPGIPASAFVEAANYANTRLTGLTLAEAVQRLRSEITAERAELDHLAQTVIERGLAVWSDDGARPILIVRGQAHLVGDGVADLERVRLLLGDLEGKEEVARLLDLARTADAMKVFIGAENKLFSLSGSSVIAAPWRSGGRVVGVVGVIGPTRLNYARVVPMVDFTANALSRLLQ
jgi:heat-inducible transcriptional repressor